MQKNEDFIHVLAERSNSGVHIFHGMLTIGYDFLGENYCFTYRYVEGTHIL